ncbi:MAG: DUF1232 domain-containing protein [Clostridiales bacterium]|nr:DUF1232 domain-containing protein [Clostridiales bacterium]
MIILSALIYFISPRDLRSNVLF